MEKTKLNERLVEAIKEMDKIKDEAILVSRKIKNKEIARNSERIIKVQQLAEKFGVVSKTYQDVRYGELTSDVYMTFLNSTWDTIKNIPEIKKS